MTGSARWAFVKSPTATLPTGPGRSLPSRPLTARVPDGQVVVLVRMEQKHLARPASVLPVRVLVAVGSRVKCHRSNLRVVDGGRVPPMQAATPPKHRERMARREKSERVPPPGQRRYGRTPSSTR